MPDTQLVDQERIAQFSRKFTQLSERERFVLQAQFGDEKTMKTIAKEMGLTPSAAYKISQRAREN